VFSEYYKWGEGKDRVLALGAVKVGYYCSSVYEGDWHRSLIVRILDSEYVKVRACVLLVRLFRELSAPCGRVNKN
jgi:hypothetical protein